MATVVSPEIAADLLPSLNALISAHYLEIACFTLLVYDYFLTLGQEVEFFWTGSWNASRILFLINRYLPICLMTSLTLIFFGPNLSIEYCTHTTRAIFFLSIIAICVNQAILLLRVWYMFPHSRMAHFIACSSFVVCTLASLTLTGKNIQGLRSVQPPWEPDISVPGCSAPPASDIWQSFIPTTVIHTVLYVFTIVRATKTPWMVSRPPLLTRLLREGGLVYFVAMVSAIFSAVGARLTTVPSVNYPAYSNLTLAVNAVTVSRLMLSARSLAGKLHTDPRWLLNPTELGRARWQSIPGNNEHEIVVEVDLSEYQSYSTRNRTSHLWGL